ncbi:MAG: hypothetical protein ACK5XU_07405 [Pseudomonadota bacterium]|jgi:hypothetical protein
MNTTGRNWMVFGNWLGSLLALIAASVHGASGVASLWALGAAVIVTVVALGWPTRGIARMAAVVGLIWQASLIATYWPFASVGFGIGAVGPAQWPLSALVILGVLAALALSFLTLFLGPAVSLRLALGRALSLVNDQRPDALEAVAGVFGRDAALKHLWQQYRDQLRPLPDPGSGQRVYSMSSAREVFDLHTVTHSRLRLDLFRNLPGILTGLGIVGTFMGIIKGIRGLHFSQDPAELQRVFDTLSVGVAEAFVVSMTAITLSMAVTLVEKAMMSSIAHALDAMNVGLDALHPPRPGRDSMAAAVPVAAVPVPAVGPTPAPSPARSQSTDPHPATVAAVAAAPATAVQSGEMMAQLLAATTQIQNASKAMADLARSLPETVAQQSRAASEGSQQTGQALRALSSRLEGVASAIEVSGRRTLETVAARLMQAEMQMVSRNQSVAQNLGELVQRIETLCSLLQQDRLPIEEEGAPSYLTGNPGGLGSEAQYGAASSARAVHGSPGATAPFGSMAGTGGGGGIDRGVVPNWRAAGTAQVAEDDWANWAAGPAKADDRSFGT